MFNKIAKLLINFNDLKQAKYLFFLLIVVITIVIIFILNNNNVNNSKSEIKNESKNLNVVNNQSKPSLSVSTIAVQKILKKQSIFASGNILPWQEAVIGAEAGGLRITEILVNVGDYVNSGQILARLENTSTETDKLFAEANLLQAEANYENASKDAERARSIADSGSLSASQIAQYLTAEKVSKAQLKAAKASYKAQSIRLNKTVIKSPDSGAISGRSATVGAVVQAGQELFRLIRQNKLEWIAEVSATDLEQIKIGQSVKVNSNNQTIFGTIRAIAPSADLKTRFINVFVTLENNVKLKANTFVQGEIVLGEKEIITIPSQAIIERDGFSYIFVVDKNNKVAEKKVTVGTRDKQYTEIKSGLEPNEIVVLEGAGFLNDGDLVHVVRK